MSYTHFPRWLRELITELGCWKAIKRTNLNKSPVLKVCQHIPLNSPLMQPGPFLQGCSNKLSDIRIIIAKCDPDCGYWYNQKTPRGFKIRHSLTGGAEFPTLGNSVVMTELPIALSERGTALVAGGDVEAVGLPTQMGFPSPREDSWQGAHSRSSKGR